MNDSNMDAEPEKKAPPTVTLHQIQLETFETYVYQHQQARAGFELVSILAKLHTGAGFTGYVREQFDDPIIARHLYTRLASAIGALFVDPLFELTEDGFAQFALMQPIIDAIFTLSEYGNSDHIMRLLSDDPMEQDPSKLNFTSGQAFAKSVLIWSFHSTIDIGFDNAFKNATKLLFPWWLGMVSRVASIGPRAHERYEQLISMGDYFRAMEISGMTLAAASDANMHCSYAVRADKHNLKRELSRMLKRSIGKLVGAGADEGRDLARAGRRSLGDPDNKPVILFPLEWWTSFHAMYRVYAPVVEQLRPHFRCIAMARPGAYDLDAALSFDDLIPLAGNDRALILHEIVDNVKKIKPDVVYYLSAGMAQWWTALSAIRLAPIQLLSLGHPATSMSSNMDYALVEQGLSLGADTFSECILELPPDALRFMRRIDEDPNTFAAHVATHRERASLNAIQISNKMRVAVPAMAAKLNYPFLKLLQDVSDALPGQIEYHFFPNLLGMGHLLMLKELTTLFPGCVVHGRTGYDPYLQQLAACDIHASPFPFGGTNSNLDSMQVGLPVLTLEGPREPHERYDAAMLRRAGLTDLIAGDKDQYKELLIRLVSDPYFHHEQQEKAWAADVGSIFYGELQGPARDSFARAILHVYRNHNKIAERKRIRWEEYSFPASA